MRTALFAFRDAGQGASRLAAALGLESRPVLVHRFPDRESLVRVPAAPPAQLAILYRSLDDPDRKLVQLLLAAEALRDAGATRILLAAPYLAYMRQDKAFHPGEAVSQRAIGTLLARYFDAVVTVEPHLHRTGRLEEVFPSIACRAVSSAPMLAGMIEPDLAPGTILVGPDSEAASWTERLAACLGTPWLVGEKRRRGDRSVTIRLPDENRLQGQSVVIVDDVLSSGRTVLRCAELARAAGATRVEVAVAHCLLRGAQLSRLTAAPISRLRSLDTVAGPTNAAFVAPALAAQIAPILRDWAWTR